MIAALALMDAAGWQVICARALRALGRPPASCSCTGSRPSPPGAGHFYTDASLADHHSAAADRTWQRVTAFLSAL